jgi:hypothetical protein
MNAVSKHRNGVIQTVSLEGIQALSNLDSQASVNRTNVALSVLVGLFEIHAM